MNQSVPVIVGRVRPSEEPGEGILNTPICEVDAAFQAEE